MALLSRRPPILSLILFSVIVSLLSVHPTTRSHIVRISSILPTIHRPSSVFSSTFSGIVTVRNDGLLSHHPILDLIEQGCRSAARVEAVRQSVQSLEDAVEDYQMAFDMDPPEGFDAWWVCAVAAADGRYKLSTELNATTAPSLIPLAHTSVLPFLSLPAALLRERVNASLPMRAMCGLVIRPENTSHPVERVFADWVSGRRVTPM
jgi:hypothetical protein